MMNNKFDKLYEQLASSGAQTRLEAARILSQMGEEGASVMARALINYHWVEEWKERFIGILDETIDFGRPRRDHDLSNTFFRNTGKQPPFEAEPPLHVLQGLAYLEQDAFSTILRLLEHERVAIRLSALIILKCCLYDWKDVCDISFFVPALCRRLRDEERAIRVGTCNLLKYSGDVVKPTIPYLVEQYHHTSNPHERRIIIGCLIRLKCSMRVMKDIIAEHLNTCDREEQAEIISDIGFSDVSETASPLVPQILDLIQYMVQQDEYQLLCKAEWISKLLGRIGPAATESILVLANDSDEKIQDLAFKAISNFPMQHDRRPLAGFLLDRITPQYSGGLTQTDEAKLLIQIKETYGLYPEDESRWYKLQRDYIDKASIPEYIDGIIRDLFSNDNEIAWAAIGKIQSLPDAQLEQIVPHLLRAIMSSSKMEFKCKDILRKHLCILISYLPDMAVMIDQINESGESKKYFFELIRDMGPSAAPLMPQVLSLLRSENAELRSDSLEIINSIGPVALDHSSELIEILNRQLGDPEESVVLNAIAALGTMGAVARPVAPRLIEYAQSGSIKFVGAAKEALSRIALAAP